MTHHWAADVDDIRYADIYGRLTVMDGGSLRLDNNEFGRLR